MTSDDAYGPGPEGDDLLAAEYVLGVLSAEARRAAGRRIDVDPDFALLVARWEALLAPLAEEFAPAPPPDAVKRRLDRRLFAVAPSLATRRPAPLSWLPTFWRGLAAGVAAALAVVVAAALLRGPIEEASSVRLAAALTSADGGVSYLALYEPGENEIRLSRRAGAPAPNRDFELWIIVGDDAPASAGVIPEGDTARLTPPPELAAQIAVGAVMAISDEPDGGSPTGQATGPVIAVGDLRPI